MQQHVPGWENDVIDVIDVTDAADVELFDDIELTLDLDLELSFEAEAAPMSTPRSTPLGAWSSPSRRHH